MVYKIVVVKGQRKCSHCNSKYGKGIKMFEGIEYNPRMPYPIKKSLCFECAKEMTDDEFIKQLENILSSIKNLKSSHIDSSPKIIEDF